MRERRAAGTHCCNQLQSGAAQRSPSMPCTQAAPRHAERPGAAYEQLTSTILSSSLGWEPRVRGPSRRRWVGCPSPPSSLSYSRSSSDGCRMGGVRPGISWLCSWCPLCLDERWRQRRRRQPTWARECTKMPSSTPMAKQTPRPIQTEAIMTAGPQDRRLRLGRGTVGFADGFPDKDQPASNECSAFGGSCCGRSGRSSRIVPGVRLCRNS